MALVFTEAAPTPLAASHALRAVELCATARRRFSCPLDLGAARTGPQLFEVADGSLAIMEGVLDSAGKPGCSKCDPPFAGGAGRFHSLPTPGLSTAVEPWLGTFGGVGHDHQEELLPWGGVGGTSN